MRIFILSGLVSAALSASQISADSTSADLALAEIASDVQSRQAARPAEDRGRVMPNPYDEIERIQQEQLAASRLNERMIAEMSQQSSSFKSDADQIIRSRIALLLTSPVEVDQSAARDLLNLDVEDVKADRITTEDSRREWLVPSISMLQNGDTSIGAPEASFLDGWVLSRAPDGSNVVTRDGDPHSRIPVRVGMILGEYGRIMAVRDTPDAYYLVLENGDRIRGVAGGQMMANGGLW